LRAESEEALPEDLKKITLATECFHKASLIHDDIEDGDTERYGAQTLHTEHGVAVALNVGDLLIGEGYRLIATSGLSATQKAEMLRHAAEGHRQLCRGQGAELCWMQTPEPLTQEQVLDIFRHKTAPAFAVALHLGALTAGCEPHAAVASTLAAYSEALGIAYQIRDDMDDLAGDTAARRPSLFPALSRDQGRRLLENHKEEAIRSLVGIDNANLKGLLRRVQEERKQP
jgi:geranylgeranyl diphosphate synthase, type II